MKYAVFDIEADGLEPTKIHCLSFQDETGLYSITDYDDMRRFFTAYDVYIGHNITLFDLPVASRLLSIQLDSSKRIVDTLGLSWYLYLTRTASHGLEAWGEELGVEKVKITDWQNLSIEEYIERCEQDVKINSLLWDKQLEYLLKLYPDPKTFWKFIKYIHFKLDCVREQEEEKWLLDTNYCERSIRELEDLKNEKLATLRQSMPKVPKYVVRTRPAACYKRDGTASAHGLRWFTLCESRGYPNTFDQPIEEIVSYDEPNPTSHPQIKDWLFSLGWQPSVFKEVKNKKTGNVKEVPQINNQFSGELNECVKALFEKEPSLEHLNNLFCINHRLGLLRGFLRDAREIPGDSRRLRYLRASISGFTNTLRFKHAEIVNLPKVNKPYGEYARGSLVCGNEYILCGADMASLEDRIKQHYIFPLDPDYVRSMLSDGFDPHLDLAYLGNAVSEEDVELYKYVAKKKDPSGNELAAFKSIKKIRDIFKNGNYACQYGAGPPKLVKTCNITLQEAKELHKTYWRRNWAVKEVASRQHIVTVDGQDWLLNPVSGIYYSLRNRKDVFSTLVQGTASYVFDIWVGFLRLYGVRLTGQFHDEKISKHKEGTEREVEEIHFKAIEDTNTFLKLNRRLDIDVKFSKRYSEIH